jgi:hypothetical protein
VGEVPFLVVDRRHLLDVHERRLLLAAAERGHCQGLVRLQGKVRIVRLTRQRVKLIGKPLRHSQLGTHLMEQPKAPQHLEQRLFPIHLPAELARGLVRHPRSRRPVTLNHLRLQPERNLQTQFKLDALRRRRHALEHLDAPPGEIRRLAIGPHPPRIERSQPQVPRRLESIAAGLI